MTTQTSEHTIVALVHDKPGVLNRVASMFRRRGFNISSLAVGNSETNGFSRMTFVVDGDEATVDQITKQLYKLIDVVKVSDISEEDVVVRELALIKVRTTASTRPEILQLAEIFRSSVVDVSPDSVILEVTGDEDKVDSLIRILKPFGIREVMRTGRVGPYAGHDQVPWLWTTATDPDAATAGPTAEGSKLRRDCLSPKFGEIGLSFLRERPAGLRGYLLKGECWRFPSRL